jgi:trans-aconitate methyltransferase
MPVALVREAATRGGRERVPEPMVMDEQQSVAEFDSAGESGGGLVGVYELCARRMSRLTPRDATVIDLGCGPAQFAIHLALRRPDIEIRGYDLSPNMLELAQRNIDQAGLSDRIAVEVGDMTAFAGQAPQRPGLVSSTFALHHLPTREHLVRCFEQIEVVRERSGCAVQLFDLARLRNAKTHRTMIECVVPALTREPYMWRDSLVSEGAAWSPAEFRDALAAAGLNGLKSKAGFPYAGFQMHWAPGDEQVDDSDLWRSQSLSFGDRVDSVMLGWLFAHPF